MTAIHVFILELQNYNANIPMKEGDVVISTI